MERGRQMAQAQPHSGKVVCCVCTTQVVMNERSGKQTGSARNWLGIEACFSSGTDNDGRAFYSTRVSKVVD